MAGGQSQSSTITTEHRLDGVNALITGASRGIGKETARWLAAAGARVLLCARSEDDIRDAADEIRQSATGDIAALAADVSVPSDVEKLAAFVRNEWGRIDVVINNAAVIGPIGPLTEVSVSEWMSALSLNVGSIALVCKYMVPLMAQGGSIINLSGGGIGGNGLVERLSAYTASKAATVVLTEALALEFKPLRIRVNAVAPGAVATHMTDAIVEAGPEVAGSTYESMQNRRSPDQLQDYMRLVTWLASNESSWLTGRILSARWDSVESLMQRRHAIETSPLLMLRRIDGDLFVPADSPRP